MVSMLIEIYVYPVRYEIHYVLPVLLDPVSALDKFKDGLVCGPVRVKVGVKDNQTTNTQVTAIMQDVGLRNYGEFNEPFFCNKAVLWAVDENGWALLACRSV